MKEQESKVTAGVFEQQNNNEAIEKARRAPEYSLEENIQLIQEAIKNFHHEIDFASNAFVGHANETQASLASTNTSMQETLRKITALLSSFSESSSKMQDQVTTLTLLPKKVQQTIESIVPDIGKEVEKIHTERLEEITGHISGLEQGLKDSAIKSQNSIEEITKQSIKQMQEAQLSALESQKKQIGEFAQAIKEEIESVTLNHGSKFLRNLAVTLILATISGGLTSWYVNRYFPSFIQINKAGDIRVQQSAVKILEAENPKISETNKVINVGK